MSRVHIRIQFKNNNMINRLIIHAIYQILYILTYWVRGIEGITELLSHSPGFVVGRALRRYGAKIGEEVSFKAGIVIDNATGDKDATGDFSNLTIGSHTYIGKGVFFDLPHRISIGKQCAISAGVMFITHADCGKRPMAAWYPRRTGLVEVGDGSWIGVNAVILSGVSLGKCCVVGAGSIVNKSFPDYSVVAGVPARIIKRLPVKTNG